jgi:Zn-dependent protease with chaperone function
MNSRSPRVVTAILLALSLWTSAIGTINAQQPQTQTQEQKKSDEKSSKDKKDQKAPVQATPQGSGKPLSKNEDPTLIGKRNINGGIIAKMSGSLEKEVALGRQIAAELDKENKYIDDAVITEYVNRVGQNLVLHSDAKVPFTIKVVDSDEVNAFALPGGFFYVNKGLILAADNEAELAGVMAHEIAHVAARHAVENQTKANLLQYGAIAGSIFLGGIPGLIFQNTAGLGLLASFMKFTRNAEAEADKLGVQYLYAAGYDPSGLPTMFEKLAAKNKKKPGFIAKAFASHPQPPDRRDATLALVARFPEREEYVISTSEFQRVKARLMRLSNARATTAGTIGGREDDGAPGRPTLKRRQTPTDDSTAPSTDGQKPSETKPSDPPKLKRNTEEAPANQTSTQPKSTP